MHCPRCGQQQVSSETKFCSRCGFQLSIVADLLQHGGVLPQLASIEQKQSFLNKKNGVGFSFIWGVFFIFLAIIWNILNAEALAEICVATSFFGFVGILLGSLIMLPSSRNRLSYVPSVAPASLHGGSAAPGLPPRQQEPAGIYTAPHGAWRTPETGELVERGSVIENTTRLLERDDRQ